MVSVHGGDLQILKGHPRSINALVMTRDGRRATSASDADTLKVWQTGSERIPGISASHESSRQAPDVETVYARTLRNLHQFIRDDTGRVLRLPLNGYVYDGKN